MPLDKTPPQVVFLPLGTPEEGVSLQGNRSGAEARDHLDHEHGQIDAQGDPEHAPIVKTVAPFYGWRRAADLTHLSISQS